MIFLDLFKQKKPIIAMLHVFEGREADQLNQALEDLENLTPLLTALWSRITDGGVWMPTGLQENREKE